MGTDPDGQHRVRTGNDGRIRLSPNVVIDWDVLRTLLVRARGASAVSRERDLLVRALHLVRGPVAGMHEAPAYSWLARVDLERQAEELIIDAADRLSQLWAEENDHIGVAQAATAGLLRHPDIVAIRDSGQEGDIAWIAMEFVPGWSVSAGRGRCC